MKPRNRLLLLGGGAALLAIGAVTYSAKRIERVARASVVTDLGSLPHEHVGLVLGCSPVLGSGAPNPYFERRIAAAAAVFEARKVDYLLVSGDNHSTAYDEPAAMRQALVARGVPAERIVLDDAGFSTLDSVVRAQKVFGLSAVCIITQRDHALRALYIAQATGLAAVAFPAEEVSMRDGLRTRLRESLARVRTLLDLHVLGRTPRFLGPRIEIDKPV